MYLLIVEDVEAEFDRLEAQEKEQGRETQLMKMTWRCKSCELAGEDATHAR